MKTALLLFLSVACLFTLGACMSPDDHDFFVKGWVNPKDLDRGDAPEQPMRPSTVNDTQSSGVVPSARSSTDWSTPAPF